MLRLACAAAGLAAAPGPAACAPTSQRIAAADLDPVDLAVRMVRFDTSHTGGGGITVPHAEMLAGIWDAAGADTEIIPKIGRAHV